MGLWSLKDYGIAGFTLVGVLPAFIIIGVVFALGGTWLYFQGLVSAAIYFLAGLGVLWILKVFGVFRNPYGYLFLLILPAMALWGWGVDNIPFLSAMSLSSVPTSTYTLYSNAFDGGFVAWTLTPEVFGMILSGTGVALSFASLMLHMKSKKYRKL